MNLNKLLLCICIMFTVFLTSCGDDECEGVNCQNGATCNTETGNCDCVDGYTGEFCQTAPDLCADVNCQNGGICDSATGGCNCPEGFTGDNCETVVDLCEDVVCQNGGTCVEGICDCPDGFTGDNCETAIDYCEGVICENGGTCNEVTGACDCIDGFTGDNCENPPVQPVAAFQASVNDYTVQFNNASSDATDFSWDFGDGNTSIDADPIHTYTTFGTYAVKLVASTPYLADSITIDVEIADTTTVNTNLPVISEASFEDDSNIFGCSEGNIFDTTAAPSGDGRDCWRNDAGGVLQITSGPVFDGDQAGKLPAEGDRVGMQEISVEANTDYNLSFWYTMKDNNPGVLTVAILDAFVTDTSMVAGATIAELNLTDQVDPDLYVNEVLSFNSGSNTAVTIYIGNTGEECRIDKLEFID